jgi:hypothetical protein
MGTLGDVRIFQRGICTPFTLMLNFEPPGSSNLAGVKQNAGLPEFLEPGTCIRRAIAQNMHIGKNILVWESLIFRHSGRAFEPESSALIKWPD